MSFFVCFLWLVVDCALCGMVLIETGELYVHLYYDIGICEEEKKGGGES